MDHPVGIEVGVYHGLDRQRVRRALVLAGVRRQVSLPDDARSQVGRVRPVRVSGDHRNGHPDGLCGHSRVPALLVALREVPLRDVPNLVGEHACKLAHVTHGGDDSRVNDDGSGRVGASIEIVVLDDVEADVEGRGTGGLDQLGAEFADVVDGDQVPHERVLGSHLALRLASDLLLLLHAQRAAARDREPERQQEQPATRSFECHVEPSGGYGCAPHWTVADTDFFRVDSTERMTERTAASNWTLSMIGRP